MRRDLTSRLDRMEQAVRGRHPAWDVDLSPISIEELDRALSTPCEPRMGGVVWVLGISEQSAAIEQAKRICQQALDLGFERIGFQRNARKYYDAALPEMFPEPRSVEITAMLDAIASGRLPLVTWHIIYPENGRVAPDGWKRSDLNRRAHADTSKPAKS